MSNNLHLDERRAFRTPVAPTLFGALPIEMRTALLRAAPERRFEHEQLIHQRGESSSGFWVIESGSVKVGQFRLDGEFRALALLGAGDSYGELAVLAGNHRAVDSVAEGKVVLRWIDGVRFERAINARPEAMRSLVGALAAELQEVLGLVAGLGKGNSLPRVAAILASLAEGLEPGELISIGQQDLGELTGLTRATINKCLATFEEQGALRRHYGKIEIRDMNTLRDAAAG